MKLSTRSESKLKDVHPSLVKVVRRAADITPLEFIVTEGLRTVLRQAELVKAKASKTMNSKHLTGRAVDLAALIGGEVRWDWPLYFQLAETMRQAAEDTDVAIRWGGTWKPINETPTEITAECLHKTFPDGPHFELVTIEVEA